MHDTGLQIRVLQDIFASPYGLMTSGVGALCLLGGGIGVVEVNRRYQRQTDNPPMGLTWQYFSTQVFVVVTPFIVILVLVLIANSSLQAGHFDVTLLGAAARLVVAFIVVRIAVMVFAASLGNKSWIQNWETRVALLIWLVIAAEYLGWLDPIIATLDSFGVAAGNSRITVWSVLKLLFTLTLFMLVAAWISRWVERRGKTSPRITLVSTHRLA